MCVGDSLGYIFRNRAYEYLTLGGNASLLSKMIASIYTANSNVYDNLWTHILEAFTNGFSGFITKEVLFQLSWGM